MKSRSSIEIGSFRQITLPALCSQVYNRRVSDKDPRPGHLKLRIAMRGMTYSRDDRDVG